MNEENELLLQLRGLIEGVPHTIANLSNASALLFCGLDRLNWAGFYFVMGDRLVLGPFQGRPACIEIPMGHGVCGTAAERDETLIVPNVHEFPGHIPCDCASNSEIVIPLHVGGRVAAVLDIDSPVFDRFSKEDGELLTAAARIIEASLEETGLNC